MSDLKSKLRPTTVGGWLVVGLLISTFTGALLAKKEARVKLAVLRLGERLDPQSRKILDRNTQAPKAFNVARDAVEVVGYRLTLKAAHKIQASREYLYWDFAFIVAYGITLMLGAAWERKRSALLLRDSSGGLANTAARFGVSLGAVAMAAAVITIIANVIEDRYCYEMLERNVSSTALDVTRSARFVKLAAFVASAVCGCGYGLLIGSIQLLRARMRVKETVALRN